MIWYDLPWRKPIRDGTAPARALCVQPKWSKLSIGERFLTKGSKAFARRRFEAPTRKEESDADDVKLVRHTLKHR